jgi:hypothetical protein
MVVVTRSRSRSSSSSSGHNSTGGGGGSGVKILTPSFRAASARSYKIYTGGSLKSRNHTHHEESVVAEKIAEEVALEEVEATASAAETLTDLRT